MLVAQAKEPHAILPRQGHRAGMGDNVPEALELSAVGMRKTILVMAVLVVVPVTSVDPLGADATPWAKLHRPLRLYRLSPGRHVRSAKSSAARG